MTKIYENYIEGVTRLGQIREDVEPWIKAEENLGLKKSIWFFYKGNVTQWIDAKEGNEFYERLEKELEAPDYFNYVCEKYFKAMKEKDKVTMYECLIIFNEMEENPELGNEDQRRRLMRLREATHEDPYRL